VVLTTTQTLNLNPSTHQDSLVNPHSYELSSVADPNCTKSDNNSTMILDSVDSTYEYIYPYESVNPSSNTPLEFQQSSGVSEGEPLFGTAECCGFLMGDDLKSMSPHDVIQACSKPLQILCSQSCPLSLSRGISNSPSSVLLPRNNYFGRDIVSTMDATNSDCCFDNVCSGVPQSPSLHLPTIKCVTYKFQHTFLDSELPPLFGSELGIKW